MCPDRTFRALLAVTLGSIVLVTTGALRFLRAGMPGVTQPERPTAGHGLLLPGTSDVAIHAISYALLGLLLCGSVRAIRLMLRRSRRTASFVHQHLATRAAPDSRVAGIAARAGLAGRLDVVAAPGVWACCHGFLRPRILASAQLLALLGDAELEAVFRHEAHHLARHDPLRLFLADAATALGHFVPLIGMLRDHHAVTVELAADRHAANAPDMGRSLAGALVKLLEQAGATPATLPGAASALPFRIAALVGEEVPVRHHIHRAGVTRTFAGAVLLVGLLVVPPSLFTTTLFAVPAPLSTLLHQCVVR